MMREAAVTISDAAFAELGIEEFVSLVRTAGLREFEELACEGDSAVVQVEVDGRLGESTLQELEYVTEWELVAEPDGGYLYVLAFYAPALSDGVPAHVEELVGTCEPEVGEDGVTLSWTGPQDAIAGTISAYEDEGVSPELGKLGTYDGSEDPLDALTDRQLEVVQTAFEMGYYDVPREVGTDGVAAELGLDPSTVTEHLQRAERNLLAQLLPAA